MLMLLQPGRVNSEGNQRSHRPITRRRVQARCRSPGRGRRRFCWQTSSSRCQCKNNAGRTGRRAKSQNRRVAFHRQRMHVWSEASQAYTVAWRRPQYSPCTRGTAPCSRAGLLLPSRMLSSSCMFTRLSVCARIMQRTERNAASRACKVAEPGEGAVKPRGQGRAADGGERGHLYKRLVAVIAAHQAQGLLLHLCTSPHTHHLILLSCSSSFRFCARKCHPWITTNFVPVDGLWTRHERLATNAKWKESKVGKNVGWKGARPSQRWCGTADDLGVEPLPADAHKHRLGVG